METQGKTTTRLADWLSQTRTRRSAFAKRVGCTPTHLTRICNGFEPSPRIAKLIVAESGGAVTLQDLYGEARA